MPSFHFSFLLLLFCSAQEVFTWLFEVEEGATYNDNGRITWQLRYMLDSSMAEQYDFDDDNAKITSRLDIQKDDVQAVLPIAKVSSTFYLEKFNSPNIRFIWTVSLKFKETGPRTVQRQRQVV